MILCHKYPEIFVGGQTGEISFLYESGQIEHILLYSSYETYFIAIHRSTERYEDTDGSSFFLSGQYLESNFFFVVGVQ